MKKTLSKRKGVFAQGTGHFQVSCWEGIWTSDDAKNRFSLKTAREISLQCRSGMIVIEPSMRKHALLFVGVWLHIAREASLTSGCCAEAHAPFHCHGGTSGPTVQAAENTKLLNVASGSCVCNGILRYFGKLTCLDLYGGVL